MVLQLFSTTITEFLELKYSQKCLQEPRGTDCGNSIPPTAWLLRLRWVEGNKELLNKSFSVRGEAVISRPGTAAKKLLLTFTSGQGQHGPPLPATQPLHTSWIGRTARWRKHHTKGSFTRHTLRVINRVEPHLSCNLNRYASAIIASQWWNMQDRCKHFFKAEREWRTHMHGWLMGTRGRLWSCANCG